MIKKAVSILFILIIITFAACGSLFCDTNEEVQKREPLTRAKVIEVLSIDDTSIEHSGGTLNNQKQMIEVKIMKGPNKGEIIKAENPLNYGFDDKYQFAKLEKGDEVLLFLDRNEDGSISNAYVSDIARDKYLLYLVIAFVILLLVIGMGKGLKAVISLVITILSIFYVVLPLILDGYNPILVSVSVCAVIITASLIIIGGISKKTFSAIAGTWGGIFIAGVIALIVGHYAKLTGMGTEDAYYLMNSPSNITFDLRGLLFAGIIMGAMGAVMDVSMSISSSISEIKAATPDIKTKNLIKAGMNVGRDIMATMSNTLILAYTGGALNLVLLFLIHDIPFAEIINTDMIAGDRKSTRLNSSHYS